MSFTLTVFLVLLIINTCNSLIISSLYGNDSGSFGSWKQDNNDNNFHNLPYYQYTMDQINDKTAIKYNSSAIFNSKYVPNATDHFFQFGNDRVTVIASNYGYTQLRMDETVPKFLNDFHRENNQFGAGIGYVVINTINDDNKLLLSTFYTGNNNTDLLIERDFSFYYRRYFIQSIVNKLSLEQTLIAPFGNDPVMISKIVINNNDTNNNKLSYFESYGGAMYQTVLQQSSEQRRKYQSENYKVSYSKINNGISADYKFVGKEPVNFTNVPGGWLYDATPPTVFLSVIGNTHNINIEIGCNSDAFYGEFGAENPQFILTENCGDINFSSLIVKLSNITETYSTFYIIYGYIPYYANGESQYSVNQLINKYNNLTLLNSLAENTAYQWFEKAIKFNTTNYPEIAREILWCYGMMRSSLSFYNLYNESILDQGTYYRYIEGEEAAWRDPLFQSLPFIFTNDLNIFKSIFRFSLKQIQPPFDNLFKSRNLPHGLAGNGVFYGNYIKSCYPTDLEITALYIATEYILTTKDIDFLYETVDLNVFIDPDENNNNNNHTHTVLDCLLQFYEYITSYIGIGRDGLIRLQTMDLSDSMVELATKNVAGYNEQDIIQQAESGVNTPMLAYILPRFYNILQSLNISYPEMEQFAIQQQNVIRTVLWNGKWINRAWLPFNNSIKGVWLGSLEDGRMHSSPQSWTVLSDVLNTTENMILLGNINKNLRVNKYGATNVNIPYNNPSVNIQNGTRNNGGIWYSRNGPLILALSKLNATDAFDEWQRNSFAFRANMFPDFWPNIWSSSDVTASNLVNMKQHGNAMGTADGPQFPVLCTHSYSWPLTTFSAGIIGVTSSKINNIIIQPALPLEIGEFTFNSALIDVKRDKYHNYYISYRPTQIVGDILEVMLDLSVQQNDIQHASKWIFSVEIAISDKKALLMSVYFDNTQKRLKIL